MITVCMATYNGEKYIGTQVLSILKQLGETDEIIVSDDNSTDDTVQILRQFNDKRISILEHTPPVGVPGFIKTTLNFENALCHAKGDYIFFSDQDDVWCDNKVEVVVDYLNKGYDYVVSDAYVTDAKLNVISDTRFVKGAKMHTNKYLALVLATPYQGSCAAFKRCVLEKAMPFPKGIQSHDRWIGNVAAFYFKYSIIPEKLIYYRRHENTTSIVFKGKAKHKILQTVIYKLRYIYGIISIIGRNIMSIVLKTLL